MGDTPAATAEEQQEQQLSPQEEAAQEALARAAIPPGSSVEDEEDRAAGRRMAARVAQQRGDGDGVEVIEDSYRAAMDAVEGGSTDEEDIAAATEWLLSDEQVVNTRKLRIRIGGSDDDPEYGGWVIRAVGVDVIRGAEREASGNRQQQRSGQGYDELKANLRIVAAGTIEPDLVAVAKQRGIRDPAVILRQRFQFRSGILAQIAGEIMSLSGFDAEDVRTAGK